MVVGGWAVGAASSPPLRPESSRRPSCRTAHGHLVELLGIERGVQNRNIAMCLGYADSATTDEAIMVFRFLACAWVRGQAWVRSSPGLRRTGMATVQSLLGQRPARPCTDQTERAGPARMGKPGLVQVGSRVHVRGSCDDWGLGSVDI